MPVRDRSAVSVAEALKSFIISRHSCPEVLLNDNMPEFTSELIQRICSFYGIKKCEVHPYKPSSNGAVERANRKVKNVLRTVVDPQTVDWDVTLEDLQFTLNNTVMAIAVRNEYRYLY